MNQRQMDLAKSELLATGAGLAVFLRYMIDHNYIPAHHLAHGKEVLERWDRADAARDAALAAKEEA